jgi:hypothetical protein
MVFALGITIIPPRVVIEQLLMPLTETGVKVTLRYLFEDEIGESSFVTTSPRKTIRENGQL